MVGMISFFAPRHLRAKKFKKPGTPPIARTGQEEEDT